EVQAYWVDNLRKGVYGLPYRNEKTKVMETFAVLPGLNIVPAEVIAKTVKDIDQLEPATGAMLRVGRDPSTETVAGASDQVARVTSTQTMQTWLAIEKRPKIRQLLEEKLSKRLASKARKVV